MIGFHRKWFTEQCDYELIGHRDEIFDESAITEQ